jgi:uncharacterized protein YbaR (Trm112 family)
MQGMTLDSRLLTTLCCPVDGSAVELDSLTWLKCMHGHTYPVVDGVPVMLRGDVPPTMWLLRRSLERAAEYARDPAAIDDPLFLDTVGISPQERDLAKSLAAAAGGGVRLVAGVLRGVAGTFGFF